MLIKFDICYHILLSIVTVSHYNTVHVCTNFDEFKFCGSHVILLFHKYCSYHSRFLYNHRYINGPSIYGPEGPLYDNIFGPPLPFSYDNINGPPG